MGCRKRINLAPDGADLIKLAAVKTPVLIKHKTTCSLLLYIMEVPVHQHLICRCILRELCKELSLYCFKAVSAGLLVRAAGSQPVTLVISLIPYLLAEFLIILLMTVLSLY